MELKKFINEARRELEILAGMDYSFEYQLVRGLNGTVKHLLVVSYKGSGISPCVNMEAYYRQYQEGEDMGALAGSILESCRKESPVSVEMISGFTDWNLVKHRIFAKLINTGKNEELLREHPHRNYLDLSLVYYVRMEGNQAGEYGMIQIRNEYLSFWEVDEDALFGMAQKNMLEAADTAFERMEDILGGFLCLGEDQKCGENGAASMYVLGNRDRTYGAVQMFRTKLLQDAAEMIGDDLWILPSSVHEIILIPLHQAENGAEDLAEIVKEVNDTQVEPQEILSYHVYRYSRESGKVIIAA